MINRQLSLSLAVALAVSSPAASAMGLGQLQVRSGLNQPLVAEIPIISATPSELDQLDVRLASPEAFSRVGLDLPAELTANLQFSIGKSASGQPVIKVTTPGRFSEPFLSFLIEADWGKGKVTREYTALIDPPYIAPAVIQPMLTPAIAAAPLPAPTPEAAPAAVAPEPVVAQTLPAKEPEPAVVAKPLPPPAPRPVVVSPPAPRPQPSVAPPEPAPAAKPAPEPTPIVAKPLRSAPGEYGPVSPGQTLWTIANSVRPDSSVSVNQMMVALLRANPEAFSQENINRLKSGSVLRVPGQEEVNRLSDSDAAQLVSQQAAAWRSPRAPVPQPAQSSAAQDKPSAPALAKPAAPRVASRPNSPVASSRLEIVPPSGNARARGAQSGAAAGAGGSELRAELVQAKEDLAARTSEVAELKSRVGELQQQDSDRQRLLELQSSQLKELQDRLKRIEAEQAAASIAASVPPAATAQPAANAATSAAATATGSSSVNAKPWFLNPLVLGAALLVMLGGLVLAMRRSKPAPQVDEQASRRLSDDEALRTSMAKTREAGQRIKHEPTLAPIEVTELRSSHPDPELEALTTALDANPKDLETHLNLLRLHHARGDSASYETAALAMRLHLSSTMDPRWREAVVMGAALMPGHTLFSQAGWNTPRYSSTEAPARVAPADAAPRNATEQPPPMAPPVPVKVFEHPVEVETDTDVEAPNAQDSVTSEGTSSQDDHYARHFDDSAGTKPVDIHRNEAQVMVEDEASATRIDLAKAYLDFGDLDGARSMLEEVLAEGGPSAKAEAARILKEIG